MTRPTLQRLRPYPFERLRSLLTGIDPPKGLDEIRLSIGEPRQPAPDLVARAIQQAMGGLGSYPSTQGTPELRQSIAHWLTARFDLPAKVIDPERHVLPVNGTREALFAAAQALIEPGSGSAVVMPNPCYQIYEGAAILAGAEPYYAASTAATGFLPDWHSQSDMIWRRCRLLYVCSPDNPSGAVADLAWFRQLIELADRHDFIIASDECYSEIYPSTAAKPAGILQACAQMGRSDFRRCLAFHSLSKRSNVPGMRSGFVAGDASVISDFLLYRTYHGCAMSPVVQAASVAAWSDEAHVEANRQHYDQAFAAFLDQLPSGVARRPAGSFYVWLKAPVDDLEFCKRLYAKQNTIVLPGSLLGREVGGNNPGSGYVRISLVESVEACGEAGRRIATMF